MEIVDVIRKLRLMRGLKQTEFANALGIESATYSRIETGKQELRLSQLFIIAELLNMRPIDLLTYPDVYVKNTKGQKKELITVSFEIDSSNKDLLLSLIKNNK